MLNLRFLTYNLAKLAEQREAQMAQKIVNDLKNLEATAAMNKDKVIQRIFVFLYLLCVVFFLFWRIDWRDFSKGANTRVLC